MKKIKRILAILGAIILAGLYISTIVCALSSNENYMDMLMASVYATVIIPVLIWAYGFIYRLIKKSSKDAEEAAKKNKESLKEKANLSTK